jgi:hypothetical protein
MQLVDAACYITAWCVVRLPTTSRCHRNCRTARSILIVNWSCWPNLNLAKTKTGIRMKQAFLRLTLLWTLLVLSAVAVLAESPRSIVGKWKLDLSQSNYGKAPAPKFEKLSIFVDSRTAAKWMITGAAANGNTFNIRYDGPIDGQFHPLTRRAGGSVAFQHHSEGSLSWTIKDKDGNIIESADGQLSPDGNTLILKGMHSGPEGSNDFVSVFTRMQ